MTQPVPAIFSPKVEPARNSFVMRVIALAISGASLSLLIVAMRLTPSPTGMGTHTQLNLPECDFYRRFGVPCPTCGMTTSFAWFARGNLAASFYVQPMGAILASLNVLLFWAGLYEGISGRAMHRLILFLPAHYYVLTLAGGGIAAWMWKIFIHVHGIDGWRM
jgi:hypothetical protein